MKHAKQTVAQNRTRMCTWNATQVFAWNVTAIVARNTTQVVARNNHHNAAQCIAMKVKREVIDVELSRGEPQAIHRHGRRHEVQCILDRWMYRSHWWAKEEERSYWHVQCADLCMEVFERNGRWYTSRIWD